MQFKDRAEAGQKLGEALKDRVPKKDAVIMGLARGGIVIAYEVAKMLNLPFGIIMTRKIGAPMNPELAIGAITESGEGYFDERLISSLGVSQKYIEERVKAETQEAKRRLSLYAKPLNIQGKTVVLVDDGIATGSTMMAAIYAAKKQGAKKVLVAAPAAPPDTVEFIKTAADEVICLYVSYNFFGVSQFYESFPQVTDEEILTLLERKT